MYTQVATRFIIIIIISTSDLQPSTAVANQLPGIETGLSAKT